MTGSDLLAPILAWLTSEAFVGGAALLAAAVASHLAVRRYLLRVIDAALERSKTQWDDILARRGVFKQLSYLAPALVIYYGLGFYPSVAEVGGRILLAYVIVNLVFILSRLLSAAVDIYQLYPISRRRPVKGYVQLAKMAVYILGTVLAVCTLLDVSPWGILSGIGAMTAILILAFKDTLLSLIASLQIAAYDLVHRGDWIEMPQFGADGDVIDVALHTIQVQNWDKTIVTIPTHKLIEGSFKNWRGMTESGGRRIKRSLLIDQTSVRFVDDALLEKLQGVRRLAPYLDRKATELERDNPASQDDSMPLNRRALTNLGTFRAYVVAYLRDNTKLRQDMTFLVRQLPPSPDGLPLEIYVFTNDTDWANYEGIQSDIVDHLLAAIPFFELRVFQHPTGHDLHALTAAR
ncbi:MAG: mechanosensitive ion channel family protein [Alphaproteobacteria bacterium]|jgi:miniconductance mechanosensitive channel|nr:mechanosensitive ion channel family protein [Alphaproteobacteria bacterium]MDP6514999.1 mechanosensitive ion channel family protein [Alphaproteobacteria bacterium]